MADRETAMIRDASPDDIPAIRAILAGHGNDDPAGHLRGPDIVGPYLRHLLAHHRAMVSETPGDEVVAFGAVVDTDRSWHLADLFVRTDRLGQGLGRPLLAALLGDRWPRTTFASDDPRALPSYVRAGMAARWVALYLRGGPETVSRAVRHPWHAAWRWSPARRLSLPGSSLPGQGRRDRSTTRTRLRSRGPIPSSSVTPRVPSPSPAAATGRAGRPCGRWIGW